MKLQYNAEEGGIEREFEVAEATCHTCAETLGINLAETIGRLVAYDHHDHDVDVDVWTETEMVECANCEETATHTEEIAMPPLGDTSKVPYCDECGFEDRGQA